MSIWPRQIRSVTRPNIEAAMGPSADGSEPVPVWCLDGGKVLIHFNGQAYFVKGRGMGETVAQTHRFARALVEAWRERNGAVTVGATVVDIEDCRPGVGLGWLLHKDGLTFSNIGGARLAALEIISAPTGAEPLLP